MFLYNKHNHFNIANLVTFSNIAFGVLAIFSITHSHFWLATLFAWLGGACDIIDGKLARKYKLSTQFGIQLDSFADFLSFVLVPIFLIYYSIFDKYISYDNLSLSIVIGIISLYYIISGVRRLISFNINSTEGNVEKYFTGVPTPLGAILLFITFVIYNFNIITNIYVFLTFVLIIGHLLNSKIKIKHL